MKIKRGSRWKGPENLLYTVIFTYGNEVTAWSDFDHAPEENGMCWLGEVSEFVKVFAPV